MLRPSGSQGVDVQFRCLGPVEVSSGGRPVSLAAAKQQSLLVVGLLGAGRIVSVDRIVDGVWGEEPPPTAPALVQTYVSQLRRVLPEVIITRAPGYVFRVEREQVDLCRFEEMLTKGRASAAEGRYEESATTLRGALDLWRGPAFGGIGQSFLLSEAARFDEMRLAALEERITADQRLGRDAELVAELTGLVGAYPLRERLRGQLMLALYRIGRQGDALAAYQDARVALDEELGVAPGAELQRLHRQILGADPELRIAQPVSRVEVAVETRADVPHQLPSPITDLTGRDAEVAELREVLRAAPCAISGKAGSGKTALAVAVAHAVREDFPDGQLYAVLRGTDTTTAAEPGDVLGGFLRSLGADPACLPDSVSERAALYRSTLSGRRVLIMLDNAVSERQVRPLLPGLPGCAVLVTSRSGMYGLEGATQMKLDVLDSDGAIDLLARVAGHDRVAREPVAAREIVRLCGRLPLAVRTAAARLAGRREWPLSVLAKRLADERRRLDELAVGDLEVRASLALSYRELPEDVRRAFRMLGVLGVPDFAPWVVAPLLGVSVSAAEQLVEALADAQLLDFVGTDATGELRYRMHDLIRVYARERGELEESDATSGVRRALRCWLGLLDDAAARTPNGIVRLSPAEAEPDPLVAELVPAEPGEWLTADRAAVVAAAERAAELGLDDLACDLATALAAVLFRVRNEFDEWWRTHDLALAAVRKAGNRRAEAVLLTGLGQLRAEQERFTESNSLFQQALPLFRELGDRAGEAVVLASLGAACRDEGKFAGALDHLERARQAFAELGNDNGIASTAYDIGMVHRETGDFTASLAALDQALQVYRRTGVRRGEGLTLRSIGLVHRATGEFDAAEALCAQALEIFRDVGDRLAEAYAVQALAKVRVRQGSYDETPLLGALEVCRDLRDGFGEALVLRTLGELALAEGRLGVAEERLTDSLGRWEVMALPVFRARTLRDLAELHARRGDDAAAGAAREDAMATFRALGCREYAEMTG